MSHLVGVKVYEEYEWEFDGRRHLAIHGHQFDRFAVNNLLLSSLGTFLHQTEGRFKMAKAAKKAAKKAPAKKTAKKKKK